VSNALIIAYGNPLRGDDGLAWRAAEGLEKLHLPDVQITTTHQLTPELAHSVSQASFVVFVDARHSGEPGEIFTQPVIPVSQSVIFTHDFLPGNILHAAAYLYGRCPSAVLVSLAGENFEHGEKLSDKIIAALPELVERIKQLLQSGTRRSISQP